jgi:hypothetical protein
MNINVRLTTLTFLFGLTVSGLNANERLTMVVSPAKSMAPATIRVRLGVEPAMENRSLEVVVDSGDFYRSSQILLDSERAPHTIAMEFPSLRSGTYVVSGMLRDGSGHLCASVHEEVSVIASAVEH